MSRYLPGVAAVFTADPETYFDDIAAGLAADRADVERRRNALTDPREQCHHHVSLYERCKSCEQEVLS